MGRIYSKITAKLWNIPKMRCKAYPKIAMNKKYCHIETSQNLKITHFYSVFFQRIYYYSVLVQGILLQYFLTVQNITVLSYNMFCYSSLLQRSLLRWFLTANTLTVVSYSHIITVLWCNIHCYSSLLNIFTITVV